MEAKRIEDQNEGVEDFRHLQEESKSWTATQWEAHLRTLEVGLKESQNYNPWTVSSGMAFTWHSSTCPEDIAAQVEESISQLTPKQQLVIRKIFFEGLSERQVARILLISRQGVFDLKKRAIRKLKKIAPKLLGKFPIADMPPTLEGTVSVGIGKQGKEDSNVKC